jgi:uncharacterized membrane protein
MIIFMGAIEIKNYRDIVLGEVPMVGPVINSIGMLFIIIGVIQDLTLYK